MGSTPIEGIERFNSMSRWPNVLILVAIEGGAVTRNFNVLGQDELNEFLLERLVGRLDSSLEDYGWEATLSKCGNRILLDPTGPSPVEVEVYVEMLCYD